MTTIEDRLEKALLRAIDLTTEMCDASKAVAKTACEHTLTPEQARFVATAYNKTKAFALGGMLPDSQRGADFQLADPDEVVKLAFDHVETPEVLKVASAPSDLPDIDEFLSLRPLLKKAQEFSLSEFSIEKRPSDHDIAVARRQLCKLAEDVKRLEKKLCVVLKEKTTECHLRAKQCLSKAADEFVKYPAGGRRVKVARRILNGFGEEKGRAILSFISKVASCDVPDVQKTASHTIFPAEKIYTYTSEAGIWASRAKNVENLFEKLSKQAGVFDDAAASVAYGTLTRGDDRSLFASLLEDALTKGKREETLEELLPADVFARIKGLKSRRAFMDAVLVNPELQEFSLDALENAFNYAMETNPTALESPRLLSNIMLHNINQGNFDDIFNIKAKKDIAKSDAEVSLNREKVSELVGKRKKSDILMREDLKEKAKKRGITAGGGVDILDPAREVAKAVKEKATTVLDDALTAAKQGRDSSKDVRNKLRTDEVIKSIEADKALEYENIEREDRKVRETRRILAELDKQRTGREAIGKQGRRTQKVGPENIPVGFMGTRSYLTPDQLLELRLAQSENRLTDKGRDFLRTFEAATRKLQKGVSWDPKVPSDKDRTLSSVLGSVDWEAAQSGHIPARTSDFNDLLIP